MKTARLLTAPVQYLAVQQDRFRNFLESAVNRVPPERLVSPAPQILGPVIEGIKYETIDSEISEMFLELLSNAMDAGNLDKAHPAFSQIIRQLSPDEARILFTLKSGPKPVQ